MSGLLYLVDSFSLIFQVYHAIPEMTGPKGQPTNAVFGFTRDLQMILNDKQPTHLICAMDSKGPGVRNELYPEYKANRDEMPEDLRPQIALIAEVIEGFRIPMLEQAGWEADDVIATVAVNAAAAGFDVAIVTSDKDARQLLGPRVQVYNVRKDTFLDETHLMEDWGVRPDQVIDFQALVGDSVDNVPGVPLVGPKKAKILLERFGTLEEVLSHADEAPGAKLQENLKKFADQARLSRKLVTLNAELPLAIDWDAARVDAPDHDRLLALFTDLGFRRFAESMQQSTVSTSPEAPGPREWEVIDTGKKFSRFLKLFKQQQKLCIDLETTGLFAPQADIVGWAVSWQAGSGYYLPVDGPPGQARLDAKKVLEALRPVLEDPNVEIVNQNIKYDMVVLKRVGVELEGIGLDPMVGHYLIDAGARGHSLDTLAGRYLNHRMIPISDLIGSGKHQKKMYEVDIDQVAEYASEDADLSWQIAETVARELKSEKLWDLYWDLERPLIPVLADMEYTGIRVDTEELKRQSKQAGARLLELVEEIHGLAGREFNIDSPLQLREILFEELGLPVMKRTKTGASTSHDVLERLAPLHPLPALIMEHRQLAKLKGTYLDALPAMVNPETGRVHASFNQVVAATGRLSSSDPNLQNIPIRTEAGRRIRRAFAPSDIGWKLVSADYSQIELRILAHLSGDPALRAAFQQDADIHASVAAEVFGIEVDAVDRDQRRVAKAVNFGVIYGQSPFGLASALGIGQDEAAEFIEGYFTRFSGVDRYLGELLDTCRRTGYARTMLGRRRAVSGIRTTTGRQRNMPERTAINTVIQGSAADLIKQAMINIARRVKRDDLTARLLLQIHDELVFEVPADGCTGLVTMVREEMETALDLDIPLVVDVSIGDNWLEMERV
jgi:DNA polymerase-1